MYYSLTTALVTYLLLFPYAVESRVVDASLVSRNKDQVEEFDWDCRVDPESAANMCFWMYCMTAGQKAKGALTFAKTRGTRGRDSGQTSQPASKANKGKYGLTFPDHQQPFNILMQSGWRNLQAQHELEIKVTDEWPPASAEEGGTGASLRGTTSLDGSKQGKEITAMWSKRDQSSGKVRPVPQHWDDPGLTGFSKTVLQYCGCGGKSGKDLETCCTPDDFFFQRIPSSGGTRKPGQALTFHPTDLANQVDPDAKG